MERRGLGLPGFDICTPAFCTPMAFFIAEESRPVPFSTLSVAAFDPFTFPSRDPSLPLLRVTTTVDFTMLVLKFEEKNKKIKIKMQTMKQI
jgi:hypothetical protein